MSAQAAAEERCGSERPWIAVSFDGEPFEGAFVTTLLGDLRAGLRGQGIDVCPAELGAGAPVARVTLRTSAAAPLRVGIDVVDAVTDKRVARDVDLARLPEDGRPFALAVATDELLRASWVELALSKREPSPEVAPPEVEKAAQQAVQRALPPAPPRQEPPPPPARTASESAAGVRLAIEHFAAGQTHFGADAALRLPFTRGVGIELGLGARKALDVQAASGAVSASALGAEGSLWVGLVTSATFGLDLFAGVRALRVSFDANAGGGATERDSANWAVSGRTGLGARVGGTLRAALRAGAGLPLAAVEITDGDRVISGVSGLELFAASGLEVAF